MTVTTAPPTVARRHVEVRHANGQGHPRRYSYWTGTTAEAIDKAERSYRREARVAPGVPLAIKLLDPTGRPR